jgi:PAS domain S-box-containing protein
MIGPVDVVIAGGTEETSRLLFSALEEGGYEPVTARWAGSAADLRAALAGRRPQVVIADLGGPGLDAAETVATVQADAPGVPVIVVCAPRDEEQALAIMAAGACDVVPLDRLVRLVPAVRREIWRRDPQAEEILTRRTHALQTLHQVALDIGEESEMSAVLRYIMKRAVDLLGADQGGGIWLYQPAEDMLYLVEAVGPPESRLGARLAPDTGVAGHVFRTQSSLVIDHYDAWEGRTEEYVRLLGANAMLVVPLLWRERAIGVLGVVAQRAFEAEDVQLAEMLAAQATVAIVNARLRDQLEQQTLTLADEVIHQTVEIRRQKEQAQTILHSIDDAVMLLNTGGIITYVNRAFTALLGHAPEAAIGQHFATVISAETLRLVLSHQARDGSSWHGEAVLSRADGAPCEVDVAVIPVSGAAGEVDSLVVSLRDIGRFKQLDRMKTRFMQHISHELRTPLSSIQLYAELLKANPPPEKRASYLAVLETEIGRLIRLTEKVIDLTRLTDPDATRAWTTFSLAALFDQVMMQFQAAADRVGITLHTGPLPRDLPLLRGHRGLLARALGEVVENAIQFSPPGGSVELSACWWPGEDGTPALALEVRDSGAGIGADEPGRVLAEAFYRGEVGESGHVPGIGLGLTITRVILERHGGWLDARNAESGSGSVFSLILPV